VKLCRDMEPRRITKGDYDQIVEVIDRWWGGPISTFAHPIFFYELGEKALIVEDAGRLVGFLLGFIAHEPVKTGYVHLVGIHPEYRRRGVGRMLYETFTDTCRAADCVRMKAITTLGNAGSQRFHLALGWEAQEIDDYAGPSRRRIVFMKDLGALPPSRAS
jgi:GNAT superfamily N-acetyltransferase